MGKKIVFVYFSTLQLRLWCSRLRHDYTKRMNHPHLAKAQEKLLKFFGGAAINGSARKCMFRVEYFVSETSKQHRVEESREIS